MEEKNEKGSVFKILSSLVEALLSSKGRKEVRDFPSKRETKE